MIFMNNPEFKGPWGIPDVKGVENDVEGAAHGVITFASGQDSHIPELPGRKW